MHWNAIRIEIPNIQRACVSLSLLLKHSSLRLETEELSSSELI